MFSNNGLISLIISRFWSLDIFLSKNKSQQINSGTIEKERSRVTAGLEFDACGQRRPLVLLCVGMKIMSVDVNRQTGLSTFSNSLISVVARCPRDVARRRSAACELSRRSLLLERVSRTLVAPQMVASSRVVVGDSRTAPRQHSDRRPHCEWGTVWSLVRIVERVTLVLNFKVCGEDEKYVRGYWRAGLGAWLLGSRNQSRKNPVCDHQRFKIIELQAAKYVKMPSDIGQQLATCGQKYNDSLLIHDAYCTLTPVAS